jgi:Gram-negative bacterial TonB protein C-terminal
MAFLLAAALLLTAAPIQDLVIPANGKGTCPPAAKSAVELPNRTIPAPPVADVHYAGTVALLVSLSDTGYVCEVAVLNGIDAKLDQEATAAIRGQVFQPIQFAGKPIAASMMIYRDFWRGDNSDFLIAENANASPDDIPSAAKNTSTTDPSSLVNAAKIDGTRYRNDYFGMSFTADGADVSTPQLSGNRGTAIQLVSAVAAGTKRNDRYSLSLFADPISKLPEP